MESHVVFLSQHIVTKLHAMNFFIFRFCQINISTSLAMMYMFVHYIYTKYIGACIYQSLNPRLMEAYQGLNHQPISKLY
jgi:hypothetical protein